MTNIAAVLKSEIVRISRKEIRAQTEHYKKSLAQHRRDIASLKRQITALEKGARSSRKAVQARVEPPNAESGTHKRFSAKGLRSHRARLGLSARDAGKLLGVSAQSVNNWEQQKAVPRAAQIEAIAALRSMGKRAAMEKLTGAV